MFTANGGNATNCSGLNTVINAAGGTPLEKTRNYWSSTEGASALTPEENNGDGAIRIYINKEGVGNDGDLNFYPRGKNRSYLVRACFAF